MDKRKLRISIIVLLLGLMVQGCSNVAQENNNKYESIYLDIRQNKKATIQSENEYQPTMINESITRWLFIY